MITDQHHRGAEATDGTAVKRIESGEVDPSARRHSGVATADVIQESVHHQLLLRRQTAIFIGCAVPQMIIGM